jgi:LacI family transcriptional regulator
LPQLFNSTYIAGPKNDVVAGALRLEGYKRALSDHQLPIDENLIEYTAFSYETGLQAARKLLRSQQKFTAIVACCDEVAVAAITAAYELGLFVPEDFSIIGYDNTRTAEMALPPLTTVSQPLYEMGQRAFHMLMESINGHQPSSEILPFEIVERKSVRQI